MNTPNGKKGTPASIRWDPAEIELLERLAKERIDLENNDPDVPSLNRAATYRWLQEQMEARGGYKRTTKAIAGRLAGKLVFPPSPKVKTEACPQAELSSESGTLRPSSVEELVLGALRGFFMKELPSTASIVSKFFSLL
jgi:hypothetical protein